MEECDLLIDIIQQRREIIGNKIKEGKVRRGHLEEKVSSIVVMVPFLSPVCFSSECNLSPFFFWFHFQVDLQMYTFTVVHILNFLT